MKSIISNVTEVMKERNSVNYEDGRLVKCDPSKEVAKGIWVKKDEIHRVPLGMQPIFYDEENILFIPQSHNLIVGTTGVGKSTVICDNEIDLYSRMDKNARPSMLVFDIKGELTARHAKDLEEKGYKVFTIDARNPFFSARYNPLATTYDNYQRVIEIEKLIKEDKITSKYNGVKYASKEEAIEHAIADKYEYLGRVESRIGELADTLISEADPKNKNWVEGARSCFKSIAYALLKDSENPKLGMTKEKYNLANVCRAAFYTDDDYDTIKSWLRRYKNVNIIKGALTSVYDIRAQVTRDGYVSSLNEELNKLTTYSVEALTAQSDIDILNFIDQNKDFAIFITLNDRCHQIEKIAMMLLNDVVNGLCDKADSSERLCLDKDFVVVADEMGNMPKIPNMANKISTYRSRKIWLHMFVQSFEQLEETYGENVANTIIDNCNNLIFLGCNNRKTKERFAYEMGKKMGEVTSVNMGGGGIASFNMQTTDVPLIHISDLDSLALGEFYVKTNTPDKLKSYIIPYFKRADKPAQTTAKRGKYNNYDPCDNLYSIKDVVDYEDDYEGELSLEEWLKQGKPRGDKEETHYETFAAWKRKRGV